MNVWAPGIRLGPYELTAPLGAGGMGEVWKARDTRVDRVVAIKRLKAEHTERFKREARAIAALNHPHICQLYDVGPDYLVMEYVEGEILTGPVPVADAVRLAVQIAEALTAAHRKGIVHRDLKPANILVAESGAKSSSVPAEAHWAFGLCFQPFGRFEESAAEMRRAVEKDPLSVIWRGVLMAHLVLGGKYEQALKEGFKALDISESEIHPHLAFAETYLALGRVDEALASAERAHRNLPQQSMGTGFLAALLVRLGEKNRADALLREMGASPTPIWGRAWYHLLCSELEAAAEWYEKMIEAREVFAPVYANSLYTEELRGSPYWSRLARMMNLPESPAADYPRDA